MSDLLNKASLVVIPSGYKEDTVYSVVPSDGSGDLSFTRASNGTRVNSAGLVEVCPWNLAEYSEQFDNSFWTKNNCTVTANNTTAPNGTNTADLITSTSTSETGVYYLPSVIGTNTWSIYAKKGTGRYLWINTNFPNIAAKFDLEDGVIVGTPLSGATPSIESVGNGWYRCIITSNTAENRFTVFITNNTTTNDLTSSVGLSYYIWGAQLNIGATAKPYFPTTDRLNVPRLTYQNGGGGCPSLLLEKQSTNVMLYSEQFDNAAWTAFRSSVTANATTSPDGTINAEKLIQQSGANDGGGIFQSLTIANATAYTYSFFAKAAGYNFTYARVSNSPSDFTAWFNLSTGVVGSTAAGVTSTIVPYGNGWYRCSMTFTSVGISATPHIYIANSNGSDQTPSADGVKGIFAWGAQLEASSYPTSLINTTSASATRVADACSKTGISSLIGQTEGVLFADVDLTLNENAAGILGVFGTGVTFVYLFKAANTNTINANVYINSIEQANMTYTLPSAGRYKIAVGYKANDFVLYVNGVQRAADNSGSVPACTDLRIDEVPTYNILANSKHNQVALFKTRLTNAELASLTTI
jgi:hypothetical protein